MMSSQYEKSFTNDVHKDRVVPTYHVLMITGLHAGAACTLSTQEVMLIGSSEDCDIVLADRGVAPHHALISTLNGGLILRALDAPLMIGAQILHPGDPILVDGLQRVAIGEAAFSVGAFEDPVWTPLLPDSPITEIVKPVKVRSAVRRFPALIASVVLILGSVAIYASVTDKILPRVSPLKSLTGLIQEYRVADGQVYEEANGMWTLSGTVDDSTVRDRIQQRLQQDRIKASLDLRTGADIARAVSEVLRAQGQAVQTRWLGKGDVEVAGRFEDEKALRALIGSRAMLDVHGVKRVIPRNLVDPGKKGVEKAAAVKPAEIVAIVRGKDPQVVDADGIKYRVGAELPGGAKLIAIGDKAWTLVDGRIESIALKKSRNKTTFALSEI
jgi:hypothetical protein